MARETTTGALISHGQVIAEPVEVLIDVDHEFDEWSGEVILPASHGFSITKHSECDLHLTDGRVATIMATEECAGGFMFTGETELEKPSETRA